MTSKNWQKQVDIQVGIGWWNLSGPNFKQITGSDKYMILYPKNVTLQHVESISA